jgi:hypothetical protein
MVIFLYYFLKLSLFRELVDLRSAGTPRHQNFSSWNRLNYDKLPRMTPCKTPFATCNSLSFNSPLIPEMIVDK